MDYSFEFDGKNLRGLQIWLNAEKNVNIDTPNFFKDDQRLVKKQTCNNNYDLWSV